MSFSDYYYIDWSAMKPDAASTTSTTTTTHHICRATGTLDTGDSASCKYCISAKRADEELAKPPKSRIGQPCTCDDLLLFQQGCNCGSIKPYRGL